VLDANLEGELGDGHGGPQRITDSVRRVGPHGASFFVPGPTFMAMGTGK
jgi:hypothetical protein